MGYSRTLPPRRLAVCAWLERIGLDPMDIPRDEALIVTPINEGFLRVEYRVLARDADGHPRVAGDRLLAEDRQTVTEHAPPGFRLPYWDAIDYIEGDDKS